MFYCKGRRETQTSISREKEKALLVLLTLLLYLDTLADYKTVRS